MKTLSAIALVACSASFGIAAAHASSPLPRSTPEKQGVSSSALLGFVEAADKDVDAMNGFMLVRHAGMSWPKAGGPRTRPPPPTRFIR